MKTRVRDLWKNNTSFIVFVALMFIFRSAIADWNSVPSGSMRPTIVEGDRILVNKMAYDIRVPFTHIPLVKLSDPHRGDIIVFDSQASDKRLVKRVIGLPGDTVELRDNALLINGSELPYEQMDIIGAVAYKTEHLLGSEHVIRVDVDGSPLSSFHAVRVPLGHYLAMGDNRDNSADSRVIGFVPRSEIVGRTRTVVVSFNYDNYYLPRGERYFHKL